MADHQNLDRAPEVFDRLDRLALYERRRRWDSTRSALVGGVGEPDGKGVAAIPSDLVNERFEWLEARLAELKRELRHVQHRSRIITLRARLAVLTVLIAALAFAGLWSRALEVGFLAMSN